MIRLAAVLICLAAPALAETGFAVPAGCEAIATVQKRGCIVSHLFRCEADAPGDLRRVDLGEEGLLYLGRTDSETQWIESYYATSDATEVLLPGGRDPASFSTLIGTGRDDFAFETQTNGTLLTRYSGHDVLTGKTVVVDGVTFEQTAFELIAQDDTGQELWRATGNEYIQRDWRTFVSGLRTVTFPNDSFTSDNSPVAVALPGQPGFLTTRPTDGCSITLSALPATFSGN